MVCATSACDGDLTMSSLYCSLWFYPASARTQVTTYHIWGEHASNYTNDAVYIKREKIQKVSFRETKKI
jgi:hypothetical protein